MIERSGSLHRVKTRQTLALTKLHRAYGTCLLSHDKEQKQSMRGKRNNLKGCMQPTMQRIGSLARLSLRIEGSFPDNSEVSLASPTSPTTSQNAHLPIGQATPRMPDTEAQRKKGSASTSCTECQRRKQKCSRNWPCDHCRARKVPELCDFKKKDVNGAASHAQEQSGPGISRKRSPEDEPTAEIDELKSGTQDILTIWGCVPAQQKYWLVDAETQNLPPRSKSKQSAGVERVLPVFPSRSITDALLQCHVNEINPTYGWCVLYRPWVLDKYAEWWAARVAGEALSPEFTCLLLRILACCLGVAPAKMCQTIEFELACSAQALAERFDEAADSMSSGFPVSKPNFERCLELFFKTYWCGIEVNVIEMWHALNDTIRAVQELSIGDDENDEVLSELEIELRRRLWTVLYIYDWEISNWSGRPHLMSRKDSDFELPNLRLDSSPGSHVTDSPFHAMYLHALLCQRISKHMDDAMRYPTMTPEQCHAAEKEIDHFIIDLPAVFQLEAPDTSLDEAQPHYRFQRMQLHILIHMARMQLCKRYLIMEKPYRVSADARHFRRLGADQALSMIQVARAFIDDDPRRNGKENQCVFCIFDTATVLCAAIRNDTRGQLHRRQDVLLSIDNALDIMQPIAANTRMGASSYNLLLKLVGTIPELSRTGPPPKRVKVNIEIEPPVPEPEPDAQAPATGSLAYIPYIDPLSATHGDQASTTTLKDHGVAAAPVYDPLDLAAFLRPDISWDPEDTYGGFWESLWDWDGFGGQ